MTIDDQLRDLAHRADQLQQVITAEEIVQRAASQRSGSFEDATVIDLYTQAPTETLRKWPRRVILAALVTAAGVMAIVAVREKQSSSPGDQPSTTVTATTLPPALYGASEGPLAAGTYSVDRVESASITPILVTIGDGWRSGCCTTADGDVEILRKDDQWVVFSRPDHVYLDACHWERGKPLGPLGPLSSVEGMVTALVEQRGWVDVTAPTDISIDGYLGKAFQRSTPSDRSGCPSFFSWRGSTFYAVDHPAGSISTVWVLDLDGTIVVLETVLGAGQPAAARAELAEILNSIHIAVP